MKSPERSTTTTQRHSLQKVRGAQDTYSYEPNEEPIIYPCVPLLWETSVPLHGQDASRLPLVASIMGAVFNVAPGGSPRTLLDAQMISPFHLVTVGADGLVVLTRI